MNQPATTNVVTGFLKQRWLTVVLVVIALLFILQNSRKVAFNILWLNVSSPLWLFLALMFLGGFAAGASYRRNKKKGKDKDIAAE